MVITIKNQDAIEKMRVAATVSANALSYLTDIIKPGITTKEIDRKVEIFIRSHGCTPAFLNYKNYPNSICASVNEEIVHCLPSDRILKDGDIVTIDLGSIYSGWCSDTAKTFLVGNVPENVKKFVDDTYKALRLGITQAVHGNHVSDISKAIETYLKQCRYGVVREFVGHGIGRNIHEPPQVPNFVSTKHDFELVSGMILCIEPIVTMSETAKVLNRNAWDTVTSDGSMACQFEHMVLVKEGPPEILSLRDDEKE
jgi:methionyl aminopeptidase